RDGLRGGRYRGCVRPCDRHGTIAGGRPRLGIRARSTEGSVRRGERDGGIHDPIAKGVHQLHGVAARQHTDDGRRCGRRGNPLEGHGSTSRNGGKQASGTARDAP
ncbi:MAG: hypothetical protein ACK55I_10465, partial [bacterium]